MRLSNGMKNLTRPCIVCNTTVKQGLVILSK